MNPGTVAGFGSSRPRYIYVAEVLYDVTLGSSGAFDTNDVWPAGLPSGYDRFDIQAELRSAAAVTEELASIYFNNDTTATNYRRQNMEMTGTSVGGAGFDGSFVGRSTGANSPANFFSALSMHIMSPGSSKAKTAVSYAYAVRETDTRQQTGLNHVHWESTAAITRIQLRTDNHPTDLFAAGSSMKLIGYRQMPLSELLA